MISLYGWGNRGSRRASLAVRQPDWAISWMLGLEFCEGDTVRFGELDPRPEVKEDGKRCHTGCVCGVGSQEEVDLGVSGPC